MINLQKRAATKAVLYDRPCLVEGETFRMVLNQFEGFNQAFSLNSSTLVYLDSDLLEAARTEGAVIAQSSPPGTDIAYVEDMPLGLRDIGIYRLALVDDDEEIFFISDEMEFFSKKRAERESVHHVRFSHPTELFDMAYEQWPSDFSQSLYLRMYSDQRESRGETVIYQSVSDGLPRTIRSSRQGAVRIESGPLSELQLRAWEALFHHEEIYIDGERVFLAEPFQRQPLGASGLSRAQVWLKEESLNSIFHQQSCG